MLIACQNTDHEHGLRFTFYVLRPRNARRNALETLRVYNMDELELE
jgi:hypothetical protein